MVPSIEDITADVMANVKSSYRYMRDGSIAIVRSVYRSYAQTNFGILPRELTRMLRDAKIEVRPVRHAGYPNPVDSYIFPASALQVELTAAIPQLIAAMREREMTVDDALALVKESPHPVTGKLPGEEWIK